MVPGAVLECSILKVIVLKRQRVIQSRLTRLASFLDSKLAIDSRDEAGGATSRERQLLLRRKALSVVLGPLVQVGKVGNIRLECDVATMATRDLHSLVFDRITGNHCCHQGITIPRQHRTRSIICHSLLESDFLSEMTKIPTCSDAQSLIYG